MNPIEDVEVKNEEQCYDEHKDDMESPRMIPDIECPTCSKLKIINNQYVYDKLINTELMLQNDSTLEKKGREYL